MSAILVLAALSTGGIAFLLYFFVALCRETHSGRSHVVHIERMALIDLPVAKQTAPEPGKSSVAYRRRPLRMAPDTGTSIYE